MSSSNSTILMIVGVGVALIALIGFFFYVVFYSYPQIMEERDKAQSEAEKVKIINEYLVAMLTSPNPDIEGSEVKVVDVLDDAVKEIPENLEGQPEIEATPERAPRPVGLPATTGRVVLGDDVALQVRRIVARSAWLHESLGDGSATNGLSASIRYRSPARPLSSLSFVDGGISVEFAESVSAVAPGQSIVIYAGDLVVGHGVIETAE